MSEILRVKPLEHRLTVYFWCSVYSTKFIHSAIPFDTDKLDGYFWRSSILVSALYQILFQILSKRNATRTEKYPSMIEIITNKRDFLDASSYEMKVVDVTSIFKT